MRLSAHFVYLRRCVVISVCALLFSIRENAKLQLLPVNAQFSMKFVIFAALCFVFVCVMCSSFIDTQNYKFTLLCKSGTLFCCRFAMCLRFVPCACIYIVGVCCVCSVTSEECCVIANENACGFLACCSCTQHTRHT